MKMRDLEPGFLVHFRPRASNFPWLGEFEFERVRWDNAALDAEVLEVGLPYGNSGRKIGVRVRVRLRERGVERCPLCNSITEVTGYVEHDEEAIVGLGQLESMGDRLVWIAQSDLRRAARGAVAKDMP